MRATNHRKPCGKPVTKSSISKMLVNPFYIGLIRIQRTGETYQGVHEPIIPVSLFKQAEAVRNGREIKKSTRHNFLFRGLFRCANCSGAMIGELQKGSVYYRCHVKNCPTKSMREDEILDRVYRYLDRFTLTRNQVIRLRKRFIEGKKAQSGMKAKQAIAFELQKIETRLSSLTDKLIDGVISDEVYQLKKAELLMEQKRYQNMLENEEQFGAKVAQLDKFLELAKSLSLLCKSAPNDQKRELLVFATSNRFIREKELILEPSEWLSGLHDSACVPDGGPYSATPRTFLDDNEFCDELRRLVDRRLA